MKTGDIILVPFPFTDLCSQKTRPALILNCSSKDTDLIVCAITSKKAKNSVEIDNPDLIKGKLPLVSFVRFSKIVTLDRKLARKTVAALAPHKTNKILKKVREMFN